MKVSARAGTSTSDLATEESPASAGRINAIALNRSEFEPLTRHLEIPKASALSTLLDLCAPGTQGVARDVAEVMAQLPDGADSMREALTLLAAPDRILDARAGVFNGAPVPCRLYGSRRAGDWFVGLRPSLKYDYELLFPFSPEDLRRWVQLQLQFSSGQHLPLPAEELSGEQLSFLLILVDAYKAAFGRSFATRRSEPGRLILSIADLLEAQAATRTAADRRWIGRAIGELLSTLVHPGGARDVGLPPITEEIAHRELARYSQAGYLKLAGQGSNPGIELGVTLAEFAASLFTWISITSLHDIQVVGVNGATLRAQEELIIYVAAEPTIWTIVTEGLTRAGADLSPVRFRLRSMDGFAAVELAEQFLEPIEGIMLTDQVYTPARSVRLVPASAVPVRVQASTATLSGEPPPPPAPAPPPASAPLAWKPTHTAPESGMQAWATADPSQPATARLDPRLEVQLLQRQGAWARILCSNGWSAWVDGRALVEILP